MARAPRTAVPRSFDGRFWPDTDLQLIASSTQTAGRRRLLLNDPGQRALAQRQQVGDDVFDFLRQQRGRRYGAVVLDPPAFIKRRKDQGKGEAAYKRLNQLAMQLLPRDGLLISCSCSYHLEPEALLDAINWKLIRDIGQPVAG